MPYAYRIDPAARLATVAFYGDVVGPELVGAVEALLGDEAWEPGFSALWDGRGVESFTAEFEDLAAVVAAAERLADRIADGTGVILTVGAEEYTSAYLIRKELAPPLARQIRLASTVGEALALLGIRHLPGALEALLDDHFAEG